MFVPFDLFGLVWLSVYLVADWSVLPRQGKVSPIAVDRTLLCANQQRDKHLELSPGIVKKGLRVGTSSNDAVPVRLSSGHLPAFPPGRTTLDELID